MKKKTSGRREHFLDDMNRNFYKITGQYVNTILEVLWKKVQVGSQNWLFWHHLPSRSLTWWISGRKRLISSMKCSFFYSKRTSVLKVWDTFTVISPASLGQKGLAAVRANHKSMSEHFWASRIIIKKRYKIIYWYQDFPNLSSLQL